MKGATKAQKVKTPATKTSKVKLNLNYANFVCEVMHQKLLAKDVETLKQLYKKSVKVKSATNIKRVADRVTRDQLRKALEAALQKKGVKVEDFLETNAKLVEKIKARKGSNYIEV